MSRCTYGANDEVKFFDDVAGRYVPHHCSQEALSGQDFCLFHNHEENHRDNEKINHIFTELLKDASNQNKRFLGIGFKLKNFHFPKEIKTKIHFEHAVFSDINFEGVHFNEDVVFSYAEMSDVSFYNSTFEKKAYFIYTKFHGKVYFRDTKFYDESNFNGAEFNSEANFQLAYFGDKEERLYSSLSETRIEEKIGPLTYFNLTHFLQGARFDGCRFKRQTFFAETIFKKYAMFVSAIFFKWTDFYNAHFDTNTSFNLAKFGALVSLRGANFLESSKDNEVYFHGAEFFGETDFRNCKFGRLFFNKEFPMDKDSIVRELNRTKFLQKADFTESIFESSVTMFNTSFEGDAIFTKSTFSGPLYLNDVSFKKAFFDSIDFKDEVDFNLVIFPVNVDLILIEFSLSTFRKRVRLNGTVRDSIDLSSVSFKGVDLTNVEFSNVKWIQTHNARFLQRFMIIDEVLLHRNDNFEDVIKIYNQLRKNYESRLLFNEAAHFFVGEMESRRKSLRTKSRIDMLGAFYYQLYRFLAWYGESVSLPLLLWAPLTIGLFTSFRLLACDNSALQAIFGNPSIQGGTCNLSKLVIDSIAAFFPIPFSNNHFDTLEHIIGLPILGTAFIALKRRFERTK